ncbi:MAG: hypothetical protein IKK89_05915 [Alistipes sp.]|nr:hypothetical protein [Alistipes sp.]MBR6631464.1 hypothetical protein [Alistipes sp.]
MLFLVELDYFVVVVLQKREVDDLCEVGEYRGGHFANDPNKPLYPLLLGKNLYNSMLIHFISNIN